MDNCELFSNFRCNPDDDYWFPCRDLEDIDCSDCFYNTLDCDDCFLQGTLDCPEERAKHG